jgi:GNAT superfamily N-acetyltransferase
MNITQLEPGKDDKLVVTWILWSCLTFPCDDGDDLRMRGWRQGEGTWYGAWDAQGKSCGIIWFRANPNGEHDLLWLEVTPPYRGRGIGQALLAHAHQGAWRLHVLDDVAGFYQHALPAGAYTFV